jgi:hypothetical protein
MLLGLLVIANSQAAVVTFGFSGTVAYVTNPSNAAPAGVAYGTPFTGSLTYDTSAIVNGIDFDPDPSSGDYYFGTNGGLSFTVSIGGHTFASTKHLAGSPYAAIIIANDYYGMDSFQSEDSVPSVLMDGAAFPGNCDAGGIYMELEDTNAVAFSDDSLPLVPPPLPKFSAIHRLEIYGVRNHTTVFDIGGPITSITAVPQPILKIQQQSSSTVLLSWPVSFQGFGLQQNTNLTSGIGWQTNSTPVVDTATEHTVLVPSSGTACFFRLLCGECQ